MMGRSYVDGQRGGFMVAVCVVGLERISIIDDGAVPDFYRATI